MNIEEIKEDIQDLEEDVEKSFRKKSPLWYIMAIFLIFILVAMLIPIYGIKTDPFPKNIPNIDLAIPSDFNYNNKTVDNRNEYNKLINPSEVKVVADRISTISCDFDSDVARICYAKALYYFVRDEFDYVNDPTAFEYVKSAPYSLLSRGGDCDDASVLLANLLVSIGIDTRFVFVPGHVYVQAKLPEALEKYKETDDWVNLDATCKNCDFGEISINTRKQEKSYIE